MEIVKNLNNLTDELTIVDFFATWCGPCKMLAPVLEEISMDNKDVRILKVDVDEANDLANEYRISAVPTLIMFKNKKVLQVKTGYMTYDDVQNWINSNK